MKGLMQNIWFRLGVPFYAFLCLYGFSQVFVYETDLEVCTGKPENIFSSTYRSNNENRPQRSLVATHQVGFYLPTCKSLTFFRLESLAFGNPLAHVEQAILNAESVSVWFKKPLDKSKTEALPIRIVADGQQVADEWTHVQAYGIFTYPFIPLILLWLVSIGLLVNSMSKSQFETHSDIRTSSPSHSNTQSDFESKKIRPIDIETMVFMNEAAMLSAIPLFLGGQGFLATWFQQTREGIELQLRDIKILLVDEVHTSQLEHGGIYLLHHHPSYNFEQQNLAKLGVQKVIVFTHLDDDLLKMAGSEKIKSMLIKLGGNENEVVNHAMVTQSIQNVQKRIDQKGHLNVAAASAKDWLRLNQIHDI